MKFYCTAGRGTEIFVASELKQVFGPDVEVISTDGKTYFSLNSCQIDVRQKLLSLKTVERIFVEVLHENFKQLDRRGLLTLLHTKLNNKLIWENCISTLNHELVNRASHPQSNDTVGIQGHRLAEVGSDIDECSSATKKKKLDHVDTVTFRVSCRFTGFARKKLDIQRTSKQMGVLISKLLGWKIDLRKPTQEVNIYLSDDTLTVGIPLTTVPLSKRSYIRHCGLRTPVAWIMADMLDIHPGDTVLDPMCGAGTILLEACQICTNAVFMGMDKDISQLTLAAENIVYNTMSCGITLLHGDTRYIPLADSRVDRVVTDAPFGQTHTVAGDLQMFYHQSLTEIARVVKPGGRIVVLTSTSMAPFLQQMCGNSVTLTHQEREPPPHLTNCDTETALGDSTVGAGKQEDTTLCNERKVKDNVSSLVHFTLKATYNVKLGETEGCIFVMLNSEKLKGC